MLVLALDTSSTVAVALHDGTGVLARRVETDPRRHAELLAPAVAEVLDGAGVHRRDVTHVVVGTGPAPFTGLRVGVATALVLGEALGVPVQGVCSLDALLVTVLGLPGGVPGGSLAAGAELVVATDAKRREVHWARYRVDDPGSPLTGWWRVDGPRVGPPSDLPPLPVVGVGGAPSAGRPDPEFLALDPGWLAAVGADRIARGAPLEPPEPRYLRRPDAAPRAAVVPAWTSAAPGVAR